MLARQASSRTIALSAAGRLVLSGLRPDYSCACLSGLKPDYSTGAALSPASASRRRVVVARRRRVPTASARLKADGDANRLMLLLTAKAAREIVEAFKANTEAWKRLGDKTDGKTEALKRLEGKIDGKTDA